jgi:hypothetical protein
MHPEVLRELEAENAARRIKSAEVPLRNRVNALEARLNCLQAAPHGNNFDEGFWAEVTATIRGFVESHVNKLKAENAALEAWIKSLEDRPPLKYCGNGWRDERMWKIRRSREMARCGLREKPLRPTPAVAPSRILGNLP